MRAERKAEKKAQKKRIKKIPQDEIDIMNNPEAWGDNMMTTAMWDTIHSNDIRGLRDMLIDRPEAAHVRSADGRGPMWWAHEYGRAEIIKLLLKLGVSETIRDSKGLRPIDLSS